MKITNHMFANLAPWILGTGLVLFSPVSRAAEPAGAKPAGAPAKTASVATPLALGAKMPAAATKMKNVDGKLIAIADVAGKSGTLVVFTCNHCPFAKAWEDRIVDLTNTYAGKGVGAILINSNDPKSNPSDGMPDMQEHAKARGMKAPYVMDETSGVARAFGATVTPEAFLFGKDGKLVYHGAIDDQKEAAQVKTRYLKDALDAVVAGKAPAQAETKSIGCGIKLRPTT